MVCKIIFINVFKIIYLAKKCHFLAPHILSSRRAMVNIETFYELIPLNNATETCDTAVEWEFCLLALRKN